MKIISTVGLVVLAAPVAAHTDAGLHLHPHVSDGTAAWLPLVLGMVTIVTAVAVTAGRAAIRARNTRDRRK